MKRSFPRIVLAGFSGSGKSTVLQELARLCPEGVEAFLDLDDLSRGDFPSVAERVEAQGWERFREAELVALQTCVKEHAAEGWVLATGGGSMERGRNFLKGYPAIRVFHLDCPFEVCWARISGDGANRPLVQQEGKEGMRELFLTRLPSYTKGSLRVDATMSPREVALAILHTAKVPFKETPSEDV